MSLSNREQELQEWFTQRELALKLKVHINTVRNWRKRQVFSAMKLPGGDWRIHRTEFERLTASQGAA